MHCLGLATQIPSEQICSLRGVSLFIYSISEEQFNAIL